MERKKEGKLAKKNTQMEDEAKMIEDDQGFVDKMKKRATVKTYGIDNVLIIY
jgi:hypothetical protein